MHDNKCAIYMINYVEELEGEVPEGTIYGSTFEGGADTSRGISTEHVNMINIGDANQSPNIFQNLYQAINIQNDDTNIVNNQFIALPYGITLTDTFSNPDFAPEYSAIIGGDSINETNSFLKVSVAILADNVSLSAQQNTFADCDYGAWAKNCLSQNIEVTNNS